MSMTNEALMSKIHKLLEHVNNNKNVNEAANAATLVQKLMMEYNISAQEVAESQGKQSASPIGYEVYKYSTQKSRVNWQASLLHSIAKHNFCSTVSMVGTPNVTLFGEDVNREAVKAIFVYLRDEVLRLENISWENHCRSAFQPEHHRGFWNQFCTGATSTIYNRLKQERKQEEANSNKATGLIVLKNKLVDEKMAEVFTNGLRTSYTRVRVSSAYRDGAIAAQGIPLRPGALQLS